jgi:aspartyl/asparaginyl beta-hydroxylase (cupin superfamily)
VIVPEDCELRVGGEARRWQPGRVFFFDHSFEHEAYNASASERVVLLLNLMHPALTRAERLGLELLGNIARMG